MKIKTIFLKTVLKQNPRNQTNEIGKLQKSTRGKNSCIRQSRLDIKIILGQVTCL